MYQFLIAPMRATFSAHVILFDAITLMIFGEEWKKEFGKHVL
jgi:hypothetical protein